MTSPGLATVPRPVDVHTMQDMLYKSDEQSRGVCLMSMHSICDRKLSAAVEYERHQRPSEPTMKSYNYAIAYRPIPSQIPLKPCTLSDRT